MQNQSPRRDRPTTFLWREFAGGQSSFLFSDPFLSLLLSFFFYFGDLVGQAFNGKQKQYHLEASLAPGGENMGGCLVVSLVAPGFLGSCLLLALSCCPQSVPENISAQSLTLVSGSVFSKRLSFDCPVILPNIEIKLSCSFGSSLESPPRRCNWIFLKMSIKRNQAQFLKCILKTPRAFLLCSVSRLTMWCSFRKPGTKSIAKEFIISTRKQTILSFVTYQCTQVKRHKHEAGLDVTNGSCCPNSCGDWGMAGCPGRLYISVHWGSEPWT